MNAHQKVLRQLPAAPVLSPVTSIRGRREGGDKKRISLRALGALALVGAVLGFAVAVRDATLAVPAPQTPPAEVVMPATPPAGVLRLPGRLGVESSIRLGAEQGGRVIAVQVAVGDRVSKGQVLARLDDVEQRAAVAGARAQLAAAELISLRAERELIQQLRAQHDRGLLPEPPAPDELLEGTAGDVQIEAFHGATQVARQHAAASLSRKLLARRVLRAPMDGIVLARNVEPGETILPSPPGPPLFVIGADPSKLRLEVEVDERYLYAIVPGPASFVVPAHSGYTFTGTIRAVAPAIDATQSPAAYVVVVDVPNRDGALAPGMSATVDLPASVSADGR